MAEFGCNGVVRRLGVDLTALKLRCPEERNAGIHHRLRWVDINPFLKRTRSLRMALENRAERRLFLMEPLAVRSFASVRFDEPENAADKRGRGRMFPAHNPGLAGRRFAAQHAVYIVSRRLLNL